MTISPLAPQLARLFTQEEWTQLLHNGNPATREHADPVLVVKLFTPYQDFAWLLTEVDPEDGDMAFGLCDLGYGFPENGYVSLSEITSHPLAPVLKDLSFRPSRPLSAYAEEARKTGFIAVGAMRRQTA